MNREMRRAEMRSNRFTTRKVLTRAVAFGFGAFLAHKIEQVSELNRAIKQGQAKMAADRTALNDKWQSMVKTLSEPLAPLELKEQPDQPIAPEIMRALEALGVKVVTIVQQWHAAEGCCKHNVGSVSLDPSCCICDAGDPCQHARDEAVAWAVGETVAWS